MAGGRLKITQPGLAPRECRIELDGHDISHVCRGIELIWNYKEITEAKLTIQVNNLEVDSGVLAMIQAHVKSEGPSVRDLAESPGDPGGTSWNTK